MGGALVRLKVENLAIVERAEASFGGMLRLLRGNLLLLQLLCAEGGTECEDLQGQNGTEEKRQPGDPAPDGEPGNVPLYSVSLRRAVRDRGAVR